jgi:hypothetical protein
MLKAALARQPRLPRFLCHIYQRLSTERLNLVTGAGISISAKVPGWAQLLERLAESDANLAVDVKAHFADGRHPEYLGQIVYHRRSKVVAETVPENLKKFTIDHEWAKAIHDALYKDVHQNIADVVKDHPYLDQLRDLTKKIPLVINFNFDDLLAAAIDRQISDRGRDRLLSVVWRPPLVERPNTTTIYHVNGVLPRISLKKRSEQLIFTEDSFADALARSPGVEAEYTFLRFVQNTMLIIGHSLTDSSLKNYLRRSKDKSPANHHYMINWIDDSKELSNSIRDDIFEANLEMYNVITIFLKSEEIYELLKILNMNERDFGNWIDNNSEDRRCDFRYYIVGPVASGKSTLLEHLRCFDTFEEWTRPPPNEMYLSFKKLTNEQSAVVDEFIFDELKQKNKLFGVERIGFCFMDRAPLDLYAFSNGEAEEKRKTAQIKDKVVQKSRFVDGEIIFLSAEGAELVKRNLKRGRPPEDSGEAEYFEAQMEKLKIIYNPGNIYNSNNGAVALARDVARHALLGPYLPTDLNEIMKRYA